MSFWVDECGGCHDILDIEELERCPRCSLPLCEDCREEHECPGAAEELAVEE